MNLQQKRRLTPADDNLGPQRTDCKRRDVENLQQGDNQLPRRFIGQRYSPTRQEQQSWSTVDTDIQVRPSAVKIIHPSTQDSDSIVQTDFVRQLQKDVDQRDRMLKQRDREIEELRRQSDNAKNLIQQQHKEEQDMHLLQLRNVNHRAQELTRRETELEERQRKIDDTLTQLRRQQRELGNAAAEVQQQRTAFEADYRT